MKRILVFVLSLSFVACTSGLQINGSTSTEKRLVKKISDATSEVIWTHEFAVGDFGINGNGKSFTSLRNPALLSGVLWSISNPGAVFNSSNGIWVVDYESRLSEFTLSSRAFGNKTIKKVALVFSADEVSVSMACSVGGIEYSGNYNEASSTIEFEGEGAGDILITITPSNAGGGIFFYNLSVCYEEGEHGSPYNPSEHGYHIVWQDEFDTNDFSQYWFENWGGGGNGEIQYYCANGVHTDGTRTAEISNGTLKISAHKVRRFNLKGKKYEYVSARINTYECWQYGYIEMRAKMPTVAGCWPAFWMLPDYNVYPSYVRDTNQGAGAGGEIDIVEFVPNDGNISYFSAHSYNVTGEAGRETVYSNGGGYCQSTILNNPEEWHTYGMLWTENEIIGYLDGYPYFFAVDGSGKNDAINPDWGFDKPYYIKLNLALGGGWGGSIDPNFTSATFEIDYIRVYQK